MRIFEFGRSCPEIACARLGGLRPAGLDLAIGQARTGLERGFHPGPGLFPELIRSSSSDRSDVPDKIAGQQILLPGLIFALGVAKHVYDILYRHDFRGNRG